MKLKLDENLSRWLKVSLTPLHHDVATAAEQGLLGQPDAAVAAAARREERVLLTLDLEFGNLKKHPPGSHPGIILFRPRSYGPLSVNRFVQDFLRETELEPLTGCLVVVEPSRIRIRRPPTATGQPEA